MIARSLEGMRTFFEFLCRGKREGRVMGSSRWRGNGVPRIAIRAMCDSFVAKPITRGDKTSSASEMPNSMVVRCDTKSASNSLRGPVVSGSADPLGGVQTGSNRIATKGDHANRIDVVTANDVPKMLILLVEDILWEGKNRGGRGEV